MTDTLLNRGKQKEFDKAVSASPYPESFRADTPHIKRFEERIDLLGRMGISAPCEPWKEIVTKEMLNDLAEHIERLENLLEMRTGGIESTETAPPNHPHH